MSAWDSFKTGWTALESAWNDGQTPIYGEPEGLTEEDRRRLIIGGVKGATVDVKANPLSVFTRGGEAVLDRATGLDLPWWAWLGIGVFAWQTLSSSRSSSGSR